MRAVWATRHNDQPNFGVSYNAVRVKQGTLLHVTATQIESPWK